MRAVALDIPPSLLISMMSGHPLSQVMSDMPPDAAIVGVFSLPDRDIIRFIVTSASFDDVPGACVYPSWQPTFTRIALDSAALVELVYREAKGS